VRVPRVLGEEAWAMELLERDGVVVHPGYFFDFPGEAYLVLSLLTEPDAFREGLARLVARVGAVVG
jgi:aspartate/methionine/tyrosine aminotransferase